MFREIFSFELRYHLRSAVFWLSVIIMFFLTFGAVTTDTVQIGGAIGNVNRNSPFVVMQILLVMSTIGVFVTTAFVASAVLRDFEYRTHELFFATSVTKPAYVLGRFLGAFVAALLVYIPVALAIVVGSGMPWIEPERIGPLHWGAYLFSFTALVVPNLLLMSSVFFGLATITRSLMYTYAGLVAFFVGYLVSASALSDLENEKIAAILDPFGFGAFSLATKYWTTSERNSQLLALEGPFLINRLLVLGLGIGALGLTYALFSFTQKASRRRRRTDENLPELERAPAREVPRTRPSFSPGTAVHQFWARTRHELAGVLKGLPFLIILALGVMNLVGNSMGLDQLFGTPVYPRTYLMIQTIQGGFLLFVLIILTFYAGEIAFRERSARLDEVQDALPVPNWVFWGSKLVTLAVIVGILLAVAMVTAMGIQLYRGYTHFEVGLYLRGVLLLIGIPFLLLGVLALALQTLANNKYVGFLLMILYYLSVPVLGALHFDHHLYRYASAPAAPYSDMNGFGHFVEPVIWFYVYWGLFAVLLVLLTHLFWVRGKEYRWSVRWGLARRRFSRPVLAVGTTALLAFLGVGSWIFYNTNVLNEYVPGDVLEARQVHLEKTYKKYEGISQPRITAMRADVDIFPHERAVDIRGSYRLRNKTEETIDSLHLTIGTLVNVDEIRIPGGTLEASDEDVGYYIDRIEPPMAPQEERDLEFDLSVRNPGFANHRSNTRAVYNGSFIHSSGHFPHLGYSRGGELQDPNERRRHGLPPVQRMPKLQDEEAWGTHMLGADGDWVDFETVVSTSANQIALAPGYLQREWEENGRRYFHYKMDAPILPYVAYLSAAWEVATDRWNDVDIAIYHHPDHSYNVRRMIEATKKSLDYFTENFGPYQHRQFRIIEFPRYARFAEAFPNTIPFSEAIGFIARLDDPDDIDYVFYVTAHELAHQWWAHQVISAGVQGAAVMVESMAQYSALMVMEKEYGPEKMRRFLKYELDRYLRGRGGELIEELPLYLVENQPYIHYAKGSLSTYALRDAVGEATLNRAFARYVEDVKFREPPYTTTLEYLSYLREALSADQHVLLEDLFETITLYDNRAREAWVVTQDDGSYVVDFSFEAHKFRADGQGKETEVPLDTWVDVGIFGERGEGDPPEGKILYFEKHRLSESEGRLEIVVSEKPEKAGIDPFHKLVDRNPDNNLRDVEIVEGAPGSGSLSGG